MDKAMDSNRLSKHAVDFIIEADLDRILLDTPGDDPIRIDEILAKSLEKKPLTPIETAVLLKSEDPDTLEKIFETAKSLKQKVYGNRIVLFAPLYIGNYCINNCAYCGFRKSNTDAIKRTLTQDEIVEQVKVLEDHGHKRLILVFGEHPDYSADYIADVVKTVYSVTSDHGKIRRVNINAAPLDVEGYRKLHDAGIGTYQIFQETYHHATYKKLHPAKTPKADYLYRLDGLNRAFEGGCDDVGIGALFGLYDWRFEVLGLITHALFLQKHYGVGPHTISFPRMQPASGVKNRWKYEVTDSQFKRLVAILRLSVPYTGLILTAREKAEIRNTLFQFGVSQIDAGSRIELGGYTEIGDAQQIVQKEQFVLGDMRSLDTIISQLIANNQIPSFCTACYRLGRTGEHFMEYAIPGFIEKFCTPNALLTLAEYLVDYAENETSEKGWTLIQSEIDKMVDPRVKKRVLEQIQLIKTSENRDYYL